MFSLVVTKPGCDSYVTDLHISKNAKTLPDDNIEHYVIASFSKIGQKWGNVMDIEQSPSSSFARKRLCIMTSMANNILETFKVIFKGKVYSIRDKELFTWTPCFLEFKESGYNSEDDLFLGNVNNLDTPQHDKANSTGESDDEG
nr:RNA-directed DNA polymerase, eukaryota [Tanacetum cinerariifolium]